ncbi:aminoglycoside phosphotransferase family protein [Faucicola mancuniensis]|uniref:aminoglycoside phosphotransferase family protein n=1 Tax=Faucicola mancuniensis TaxID=1309795 RepID=UPI0039772A1A
MQNQRDTDLHAWLSQIFADQHFEHHRLAGDASFRSYHRLTVDNEKYIVMDAPPAKESVKEFIAVDTLMADFVHVPKLVAVNETQGFIVLEDLGATDFADKIGVDTTTTENLYQKAMQTILKIQQIPLENAKNLQNHVLPNYDETLLKREMALFDEWFLPYINVTLDEKSQQLWQNVQNTIVEQVTNHQQVVVHRDFHSRNLMIVNNDLTQDLGVIDFQDAVIGSYTYDLASLLRDAYINFDENWVNEKLTKFYELANIDVDFNQFKTDFNVMSMQRHLKVLGIFVRLFQRDGKNRYLANLPKVFADLLFSLENLTNNNVDFNNFYQWLNDEVMPKCKDIL